MNVEQALNVENVAQGSRLAQLKSELEVVTPVELADRYQFVRQLGEGSQGSVFEAIRKSDGLTVAIKRIRIDSISTWKEYDLFHREAEVLSSINEHGVAEFYEAIECLKAERPAAYIVQELIEGRSLQVMLKQGFRFTVSRIFHMAIGLIDLLEKLHKYDPVIIHRDIKPNNIIMKPVAGGEEFEPYLIDFGAVANPTVQKGGSTMAGTYGYMPPEQLIGRPCPASDIYALGATIVYMLCGVEPSEMRVADNRLIFDPYLENVPRPIISILHQMMEPRADMRLCDYEKLRFIFTQFSKDNYNIGIEQEKLADELIESQLEKVNAFNQSGNLDLWMQLDEIVPRDVPETFSNVIISLPTNEACKVKQDFIRKSLNHLLKRALPMLVATAFLVLLAYNNRHYGSGSFFALLAIFLGPCSVIYLVVLLSAILSKLREIKEIRAENLTMLEEYNKVKTSSDVKVACGMERIEDASILTLLKLGRKAIATIVDFEDLPVPERFRRVTEFYIKSSSRVPFRLRYRFNPPDDASADDLVHEITIYNHQTEGLEPGTPIPILYYINPKDNSDVISMPYPYPFKEIENTQITIINKENLYARTIGVY